MEDHIIQVENIRKSFTPPISYRNILKLNFRERPSVAALKDVSFCVPAGSLLGILGPNGAGKTTILKTIATLILPDKGRVTVNSKFLVGRDDEKIKSLIGLACGQERSFYWRLTGLQNLKFFAALYGLTKRQADSRLDYLLRLFDIDYADKRFDSYSSGMKQKLALVRALLHDPRVLLLDEPTKSLDITTAANLRDFIKKLVAEHGKTIIYTTHSTHEAQYLGGTFLIMDKGEIKADGRMEDLRKKINNPTATLEDIFLQLCRKK
ncbi:MAG TPA: ABC transporter ATP-binding protein [Candidatus Omnitrophica bacterium]|nr:ABC transporter ATP-binding protein [Candidatus Omnitrophota bacterium]